MEIRVYNPELNLQGIIENQTSFLWDRRYFSVGSFELTVPLTPDGLRILAMGNLVSYHDAGEAGVIERLFIEESTNQLIIRAQGRFLPSYLDRRLIRPRMYFSGTIEDAMRTMFSNANPIPRVSLGTRKGFTERVEFQATYKNLLDYETKMAQLGNIGFKFVPDFTAKTITFEMYRGIDRSKAQSDRSRVIFSEDYDNIDSATYEESTQLFKNVGYVGGEGEGVNRVFVVVGDDSLSGLARREVYIDAKDLRQDGQSASVYADQLRQRGNTRMKDHSLANAFECVTEANKNFVYRQDYDVGDIITVEKKSWGITEHLRLTGVCEVYERGQMQVVPTFGTLIPQTVSLEDN